MLPTSTLQQIFNQEMLRAVEAFPHLSSRVQGWTLTFNRRTTAVGLCHYAKRQIQLSVHYNNNVEQVTNTIRHEIAHALWPRDSHGKLWRETFIKLGGTGERCASAESVADNSVKHKWEVVAPCGKVVAKYQRKPKLNLSTCYLKSDKENTYGKLVLRQVV